VFFAGTAVEITPIRSVDRIPVGSGKRGPVTTAIQQAFFDYVSGVTPDRHNWLTPVEIPSARREAAAAAGAKK
jgi:branched-chain amino acid aminotransferase